MAKLAKFLQGVAGAAGGEALNVEDVFSTYLYEGNAAGQGATAQSITNNIDLSGEGGLVWLKNRDSGGTSAWSHYLFDTERGATKYIRTNVTNGETTSNNSLSAFNSDGFTLGETGGTNNNGDSYASWTFRKAPKFFDVVTYTGNGTAGRTVSHNLGCEVGMIIVKATSTTGNWWVYHRSAGGTVFGTTKAGEIFFQLEGTNAANDNIGWWNNTDATSTDFTLGSGPTNTSGVTYVAYLFAHNDGDGEFGPDGDADIIKCGSYTGNGSATGPEIDLGFEPQWLLVKIADQTTAEWVLVDNMRGITSNASNSTAILKPNASDAEITLDGANLTSTGFKIVTGDTRWNYSGANYIYIAIRRGPMAVPEDATDVFDIATRDGTEPHFNSNFDTVDFALYRSNISGSNDWYAATRLTTNKILRTNSTAAEIDGGTGFVMDFSGGWYGNSSANSSSYSWMWKRAPNYFDVVAYTGTGSARTVSHNLGVAPEMMWVKRRDGAVNWRVYHKNLNVDGDNAPETDYLDLNTTNAAADSSTRWNDTAPTESVFTVGTNSGVNASGGTYIAYLFASVDGVSKVGSYTGNGTNNGDSQNIDCGFSNGAKFVLIKDTDASSNWFVVDTVRGLVAGDDKHLALNTTSAQQTDDVIDPYSAGFTVVRFAGEFNQSGRTYIFYAIAA